jgi:hypothetical protein
MKNPTPPKHEELFKDDLTPGETAFLAAISLAWIFIVIEIFKLIF